MTGRERSQQESTRGRALLDEKRNSTMKTRIVKQGFREDHAFADGPDFNYYSNAASLESIRASLFRHRRASGSAHCNPGYTNCIFTVQAPWAWTVYVPALQKPNHWRNRVLPTKSLEYTRSPLNSLLCGMATS